MKIAFDSTIFVMQKYGGISRYFCSLASALPACDVTVRIFAGIHRNVYLAESPQLDVAGRKVPGYPPRMAWAAVRANSWAMKKRMARWRPQLVHRTYYDPASVLPRLPNVITIYDMIPEKFFTGSAADAHSLRKRKAVETADHVLAISAHTSADLQELWGVDPKRITVTHLAPDILGRGEVANHGCSPSLPSIPFLLFVGNRSGYKNFEGLVAALGCSQRLRDEFGVVAFGGPAFTEGECRACEAAGVASERVFHIRGDDRVLAALYDAAAALVYPSLYEGFGLPPLEAMLRDCPVCVSKTSCLPEVVGNAGEYFDPADPESIAAAIERVVGSPSRRNELVIAGRQQAGRFSWESCAAKTAAVYRSLVA